MNFEIELLKALVEIVKQGGTYAVIGVCAYALLQIIKVGTIGGIIWGIINSLTKCISNYLDKRLSAKTTTFQAFSDKASEYLIKAVTEMQETQLGILKDFGSRLDDLHKKLNEETKTTSSPKS